jgi:hypothetical protein
VKAPYEQFTEARSGQGVFTFLTGEGGFLQEFLYGYSGLRWREDRLRFDPMLPPQLSGGLRLTGLRWQGRLFDIAVRRGGSVVTLKKGRTATVETSAGTRTLSVGAPVTVPTRTAGPTADNVARCRPATVTDADPSAPAVAAVDGSPATVWTSDADPATPSTVTVTLPGPQTIASATATWQDARPLAPYTLQVRAAGAWRTVATVRRRTGTSIRSRSPPWSRRRYACAYRRRGSAGITPGSPNSQSADNSPVPISAVRFAASADPGGALSEDNRRRTNGSGHQNYRLPRASGPEHV